MKGFPDYDDVVADVIELPGATSPRVARADRGVAEEQLLLDPGLDLGKSPDGDRSRSCGACRELGALGRPLLLAISRKDFVGAVTGRRPADARRRDAGRDRAGVRLRLPARCCACTTWRPPPTSCSVRPSLRR